MGIKGFIKWLANRYPLVIRSFSDISRPVVNNLYIDFNQILFMAQNMCINKKKNELLTNEAFRYLDSIVQFVRPTTLIFIAIDGAPPYNKIFNQMSTKRKNFWDYHPKIHGDDDHPKAALFFPGTPFIHNFQNELRKFIKGKTTNDAAWMNPQVIYSSVYNPGESEHKILEFIQKRSKELKRQRNLNGKEKNKSSEVHCVFSADGDLVPLVMLTPENNFLLMRPIYIRYDKDKFYLKESHFELIYINILREYLIKDFIHPTLESIDMDPKLIKANTKHRLHNIFSDWVLLLTLAGNDFFNGFTYFVSDNFDHIQELMNLYEEHILRKNLSLFDKENKEIKLDNLAILLKAFIDHIGEKVDMNNFNDKISKECEKFLDNFHWILKYYFDKCPSWSYHYSCGIHNRDVANADEDHPLTFSDLYIYIQKMNENQNISYEPPTFEDDSTELTPFEYILSHYPSWQNFLPNSILRRVEKFMNDYEKSHGNTDLSLFSYNDIKQIVRDSIPEMSDYDKELNYSTNEFLIIDSGNIQYLSFENVTLKPHAKNVWIPSLNKINDFFRMKKKKSVLMPMNSYEIDEHSLNDLKEYIKNKVILVDYPFLKPFIVKSVKMEKSLSIKEKYPGISFSGSSILMVIGYPIVISSTDRSSTVVCSQLESHPYCLTVPLVPQLHIVLDFMKTTPSTICKNHKVLITHKDYYGEIGKIVQIDQENEIAIVKLIEVDKPNLKTFFNKKHDKSHLDKEIESLENILINTPIKEKEMKDELSLRFDDLIWEGKGIEKEQHVKLGDRVVSVTHGGPIEFGKFGTVINYSSRYEEVSVVFDQACKYGCSLHNKLKTTRGIVGKTYDFFVLDDK